MSEQRAFARHLATTRHPLTTMIRATTHLAALILMLLLLSSPAHGQELPSPLGFDNPGAVTVIWPAPIRVTVNNNTTDRIVAMIHVTNLTDPATEATLLADETITDLPSSITLESAGQSRLSLTLARGIQPRPGAYTGSIVISEPSRNIVLRKSVTVIVPEERGMPMPVPAVQTWTLNALRIFPFTNPICLRGLSFSCTLPVLDTGGTYELPVLLGYLSNERGGGLAVTLTGTSAARAAAHRGAAPVSAAAQDATRTSAPSATHNARLALAFVDEHGALPRWGLTGVYAGQLQLGSTSNTLPNTDQPAPPDRNVDLTITVKDIFLWPILVLILGVWAAREAQRYLTVHRDTRGLLIRLDAASRQFAEVRASIYGYTVREDFLARRQQLETQIKAWDRAHFGVPTAAEQERFNQLIADPLAALESHVAVWSTFRDKLDRLRRKMEHAAKPAIQQAEVPTGLTVEIQSGGLPSHPEPRFFTVARSLLQGCQVELGQLPNIARRIDQAADISTVWGEYDQMVTLVRDGLRQLYSPAVELSISEEELLERARHHLNSAARDLWEARDLAELRERETHAELAEARDIVQRLLDPFVYYAGAEETAHPLPSPEHPSTDQAERGNLPKREVPDVTAIPGATAILGAAVSGTTAVRGAAVPGAAFAPDDGASLLDSYPTPAVAFLKPLVRSYARLNTYHLPGLDAERSRTRPTSATRTTSRETAVVGERTVTWAALITALIAGLNYYAATQFGTFADYLTLFTWAFAIKIGLELANALLRPINKA